MCLFLKVNTDIQKGSALLYKKILKEYTKSNIINNISLIAACVYVNIKGYNAPKSIQEIAEAFKEYGHRVTPRLILRDAMKYTKVVKPFILKLRRNITPTSQSKAYLTKMVNQVINELSDERIQKKAKSYAKEQFKIDLMKVSRKMLTYFDKHKELKGGKNPQIFTASTIYCADLIISLIRNIL